MMLNIYVDGSYNKDLPNQTHGAYMILRDDNQPVAAQRISSSQEEFVGMWNVGGELLSTIFAMKALQQLVNDQVLPKDLQVNLYHDYVGIYEFVKPIKPWVARTMGTKLYAGVVNKLRAEMPGVSISYKKVKSHSGNKWNDVVDLIAKGDIPEEYRSIMLAPVQM